jgi:hypothetical protein
VYILLRKGESPAISDPVACHFGSTASRRQLAEECSCA